MIPPVVCTGVGTPLHVVLSAGGTGGTPAAEQGGVSPECPRGFLVEMGVV